MHDICDSGGTYYNESDLCMYMSEGGYIYIIDLDEYIVYSPILSRIELTEFVS